MDKNYSPKKPDFLPNKGTIFDDQRSQLPPTEEQLNSLALRMELNQRAGVAVYVHSQEERSAMRKVVHQWWRREELHHEPDVWVDPTVKPGEVSVRYPV